MLKDELEGRAADELEGRHPVADGGAQAAEQLDRDGRRSDRQPGGDDGARTREELEGGGGDDTEGALGADEELLEVVAGVVLAKRAQAVPDLPVGEHDLEAEHELAGVAVAQHLHATGVGGNHATDFTRTLAGQGQRKQPVGLLRRGLHGGQRHASFGTQRVVGGIHAADAPQPRQVDHHRGPVGQGRGPATQAGVAALGHHRAPRRCAGPHHRRHLRSVGRQHHRTSTAGVSPAPVGEVGRHVDVGGKAMGRADDAAQGVDEGHERAPG